MAAPQSASLTELAAQISANARSMTDLLGAQNMLSPTFAADAPPSVPIGPEYEEIQTARMALVEAASTIRDLALGPDDAMKWMAFLVRWSR